MEEEEEEGKADMNGRCRVWGAGVFSKRKTIALQFVLLLRSVSRGGRKQISVALEGLSDCVLSLWLCWRMAGGKVLVSQQVYHWSE